MKTVKRISLIFLAVIVLVIIAAAIFTRIMAKSGLPDYNADINLPGLQNPVTVMRDSYAVPHIYAENDQDLYRAVGYLSAQDRLWQMDLLRRVTLGRLSEIFGSDFIETDLLLRSLRFSEKSAKLKETSDPELVAILTAYAEGVNQYIEDNKGNYPFEFKLLGYEPDPWEVIHSLNLIGYMAWDLKSGWSEFVLEKIADRVDSVHLAEILPDAANQKTYVYHHPYEPLLADNRLLQLEKLEELGLDIFSGSNNWAVSGQKSNTGSPLLANDMHLGFGIPGIWMQMHQVVRGGVNVTGLVLPGQPLVIVGHNDSIAWGMTNTYVDNLDYYEEEIHPGDSTLYRFNGDWRKFEVREETILSKDGTEHRRSYLLNHRGPVVSGIKGVKDRVLTIHWVGDELSNEMRSVYLVNRAANWEEFREAFTSFRSISQNVVYADRKGNIGLYCCAGVPIRKRDKIFAILPGNTDEYDWQGMVPFDELPHEYNPSRGFVSSANNRTVDSTYPYHIGTWFDMPYRMDRIHALLMEKQVYTAEDFQAMQADQRSVFSELFLGTCMPLLADQSEWNETEKAALEALKGWDYRLGASSSEATISEFWWFAFLQKTFADELGEELFKEFAEATSLRRAAFDQLLKKGQSRWLDDLNTADVEDFKAIAIKSFRQTIADLSSAYGTDLADWQWGKIHTFTLSHPLAKVEALNKVFKLNRGPFEVGGSFHTVSPYKFPMFDPAGIYHGSSHRSIYDLSDWDKCISVIPTGMSGIPASRHYCDQTELYVKNQYHPDFYREEKVREGKVYEMEFTP